MFTKAEEQFLELYRSGIWEKPVRKKYLMVRQIGRP